MRKNSDYKSSSKFCPTAGKSGQLEVFESFKDFVTGIDCKTFVLVSTLENNSPCWPVTTFKRQVRDKRKSEVSHEDSKSISS